MKDEFSRRHPMVNIIFYLCILGLTMFQMQAGLILLSFFCALIYHLYLKRSAGIRYLFVVMGIFLISLIINPLFSHKGATLLFYLPTGNPVTKESLIYGVAAAIMIAGALLWFSSMNEIITSDKIIEFVGRGLPHFALLLSMIFRFIPMFSNQIRKVYFTQQALGANTKGIRNRIKLGVRVFSITTTWALEHSVDTADSMKSRGYGSGKRTTYHNYRLTCQDLFLILWILIGTGYIVCRIFQGDSYTYYYPYIEVKGDITTYIVFFLLCMTPMMVNGKEELEWHRLQLKD